MQASYSPAIRKVLTGTHSVSALTVMTAYLQAWNQIDITLPEPVDTKRAVFRLTGPVGNTVWISSNSYAYFRQALWEFIDSSTVRVYLQTIGCNSISFGLDWELTVYSPPTTVYHGVALVTGTQQGYRTKSVSLPRTHNPAKDELRANTLLTYTHWFAWLIGGAYAGVVYPRLEANQISIYFSDNYGTDQVRVPYSVICPTSRS